VPWATVESQWRSQITAVSANSL